jgi:hypothetical protein
LDFSRIPSSSNPKRISGFTVSKKTFFVQTPKKTFKKCFLSSHLKLSFSRKNIDIFFDISVSEIEVRKKAAKQNTTPACIHSVLITNLPVLRYYVIANGRIKKKRVATLRRRKSSVTQFLILISLGLSQPKRQIFHYI